MFYVYILYSSSLEKFYVGVTDNIERRIAQHNYVKGKFTSMGIPWELVIRIECKSRSEAMMLETQIKKRGIKRYLQDSRLL